MAISTAHLLSLATRIEGKGQLNIGKVLRAVADSLARHEAYELGLSPSMEEIIRDIEQMITELSGLGFNQDFVIALENGKQALISGRQTFSDEFPDPYICRRCGQCHLGEPNSPCSICSAWPSTFQHVRAVYWFNEFDPIQAIEKLEDTPRQVSNLLGNLDESILAQRPVDGGWSIHQVVAHLRDAQSVLQTRIKLIIEQENPSLSFQPVFAWAEKEEGKAATTRDIFATYRASRDESLSLLGNCPLRDWWRTGLHEEFGRVTLKDQVNYFAAHELTHLRQIALRAY
jgi:DinB family protein